MDFCCCVLTLLQETHRIAFLTLCWLPLKVWKPDVYSPWTVSVFRSQKPAFWLSWFPWETFCYLAWKCFATLHVFIGEVKCVGNCYLNSCVGTRINLCKFLIYVSFALIYASFTPFEKYLEDRKTFSLLQQIFGGHKGLVCPSSCQHTMPATCMNMSWCSSYISASSSGTSL